MKGTYPKNRALIAALALAAWFGVSLQLFLTLSNGKGVGTNLVSFFGYFTILTNLLVCFSLTWPLLAPASRGGQFFARSDVTAWVATSILFVGLSYHVLLRNLWHPEGLQLVADRTLHYIVPVLYLLYWWFYFPKGALRFSYTLLWGIYPTVYLVYILIRGSLIGNYPYGFVDPLAIGYARTFINGVGLLGVFIALGLALIGLGRLQRSVSA